MSQHSFGAAIDIASINGAHSNLNGKMKVKRANTFGTPQLLRVIIFQTC